MDRRIGTFCIRLKDIRERPEQVREFFNRYQIIVVRAELKYIRDAVEYEGIADIFDELKAGDMPQDYEIIHYKNKDEQDEDIITEELRIEMEGGVCK